MRTTFLFFILFALPLYAQQQLRLDLSNSCRHGGEAFDQRTYSWEASPQAQDIVRQICDVVGIKSNFDLKSGSVPNATATVHNNRRLIIYSENYLLKINQHTGSGWAATGIFAHEIGHHLNNHPLEDGESRPEIELEADEFSGFVLARMGATIEEAQTAVQSALLNGSNTHPPRRARLEAVAQGWKRANGSRVPNNEDRINNKPDQNRKTILASGTLNKYVDNNQRVEVAFFESEDGDLSNVFQAVEMKFTNEGLRVSNTFFRRAFSQDFGKDLKKIDIVTLREMGLTDKLNCICQITSKPVTYEQSTRGHRIARGELEVHILNLKTGRLETIPISASGAGMSDSAALSSLVEHFLDSKKLKSINTQQCN